MRAASLTLIPGCEAGAALTMPSCPAGAAGAAGAAARELFGGLPLRGAAGASALIAGAVGALVVSLMVSLHRSRELFGGFLSLRRLRVGF
jgi:hypothetical protein